MFVTRAESGNMNGLEPSGSTELKVEQLTYIWEIRRVDQLVNPKIRQLCKLRSPTFIAGNSLEGGTCKQWHLELYHTKNDWMKCRLVPEPVDSLPATSSGDQLLGENSNNDNNNNNPSNILNDNNSASSSGSTPGNTSILSSLTLTPSQITERVTGSLVYSAGLITTDGKLETLQEMLDKSQEIDNWAKWATNFCEKRRKMGCVEFLFGENSDCSVNAIPMDYLWEKRDRYVRNNAIKLQVELLFTQDVALSSYSNQSSPNNNNNSRFASTSSFSPPNQQNNTKISNNNNNNTNTRANNSGTLERSALEVQSAFFKLVLAEKISGFLHNERCSDIILKCCERLFPAHKLVLLANAENFSRSLMNNVRPRECPPSVEININTNNNNSTNNNNRANINPLSISTPISSSSGSGSGPGRTVTVLVENMCPSTLEHLLEFVYKAEIPGERMDMQALSDLGKVAKLYSMHDLYLLCCLHGLELFKKYEATAVQGQSQGQNQNQLKLLLRELFQNADPLVFQHCPIEELRRTNQAIFSCLEV